MLQKENRLTKDRDFNLLIKNGSWFNTTNFSLRFLDLNKIKNLFPPKENPEMFAKQLRVGFVVGVKFSKKAVERNRIKRQMREVVRLLVKDNKIKNSRYLLFVAKAGVVGLEYGKISEQITSLLKQANCLV